MTCIIAARGRDGTVLVSDRLVSRGDEVYERGKVEVFEDLVAMGFSGVLGIRDKLIPRIRRELAARPVVFLDQAIDIIEDLTAAAHDRYAPRLKDDAPGILDALLIGRADLDAGEAEVHRLRERGYAERVHRFDCVGSAGQFAKLFLKLVYDPDMTTRQLLAVAGFVVLLIEGLGIDTNVGFYPEGVVCSDTEGVAVIKQKKMEAILGRLSEREAFQSISKSVKSVMDKRLSPTRGSRA